MSEQLWENNCNSERVRPRQAHSNKNLPNGKAVLVEHCIFADLKLTS